MQETLEKQQEILAKLSQLIKEYREKGNLDKITSSMPSKEQAELNLSLAYTLTSLYYSYLKLNGLDTSQHPISNEIKRVQTLYTKLNQNTEVAQQQPRPFQVDREAAKRLVLGGVSKKMEEESYQMKQEKLLPDEKDNSKRLDIMEHHKVGKETKDLDIWKSEKRLSKGALIPKAGHLSWKKQIEKILE